MTSKLFNGEVPPTLTVTFTTAVVGYDSVVLRFFEPNSVAALLDVTVNMAGNGLSGTATLSDTDLADFTDQVYDCLPLGVKDGKPTALFESPVKFIVRTLPTVQEVS